MTYLAVAQRVVGLMLMIREKRGAERKCRFCGRRRQGAPQTKFRRERPRIRGPRAPLTPIAGFAGLRPVPGAQTGPAGR